MQEIQFTGPKGPHFRVLEEALGEAVASSQCANCESLSDFMKVFNAELDNAAPKKKPKAKLPKKNVDKRGDLDAQYKAATVVD